MHRPALNCPNKPDNQNVSQPRAHIIAMMYINIVYYYYLLLFSFIISLPIKIYSTFNINYLNPLE